jgi:hypothetical protein
MPTSRQQGDLERATSLLQTALATLEDQGQAARAARLLGAAAAVRTALSAPVSPAARATYACTLAASQHALGDSQFATTWDEGMQRPESVVAEALDRP